MTRDIVRSAARVAWGLCACGGIYMNASAQVLVAEHQLDHGDPEQPTQFGWVMDLDGDTLVVAAPDRYGPPPNLGAVFCFTRTPTGWSLQAEIRPSDPGQDDGFGCTVGLSGDTLAVGAPLDDDFATDSGSIYVFERTGGSWSEVAKFHGRTPINNRRYGSVLAIHGDRIVARTPRFVNASSVEVIERVGTTWQKVDRIDPPLVPNHGLFGRVIDLEGDLLSVGGGWTFTYEYVGGAWILTDTTPYGQTQYLSSNELISVGDDTARTFTRVGGAWVEGAPISTNARVLPFERLWRASVSGDLVAIGSPLELGPNHHPTGTVMLYRRDGTSWDKVSEIRSREAQQFDGFGTSLTFDGNDLLVGATGADAGHGVVYVIELGPDPYPTWCRADGPDAQGCSMCPCGNDTTIGLGGCTNELGWSAMLVAGGEASVTNDTLRINVDGARQFSFADLVSGDDALPFSGSCAPGTGVTDSLLNGLRCVGNNIVRYGARHTTSRGTARQGWGGEDGPPGGILAFAGYAAGSTRHFQVLYRDRVPDGCPIERDLGSSSAISVTVLP